MAYFAPYIDSAGMHIPTYSDIRDNLLEQARAIFGQDIYLEIDSQDYQWISVTADKINDVMQLLQATYNSRGPSTAIGSALDIIVKLNGIKRKSETYSSCTVALSGIPNTIINNGIAQDINGYNWDLPASVTIGDSGTISVVAVCETAGPIYAGLNEIERIVTPTYGWNSITNNSVSNPGTNVESDSLLRSRQAISTAQPSKTVLEGLKGAIAEVSNVVRFEVYENDTNAADSNGLPAHSITAVVEGGDEEDIANIIFDKKGPGVYTNGSVAIDISDSYNQITTIRFYRPTYIDTDITIDVKALSGYTTQTTQTIKDNIVAYENSLSIGDDLSVSSIWGAGLTAMASLIKPTFSITSITIGKHGQAQSTSDIVVDFDEVIRGNAAYITINVT